MAFSIDKREACAFPWRNPDTQPPVGLQRPQLAVAFAPRPIACPDGVDQLLAKPEELAPTRGTIAADDATRQEVAIATPRIRGRGRHAAHPEHRHAHPLDHSRADLDLEMLGRLVALALEYTSDR